MQSRSCRMQTINQRNISSYDTANAFHQYPDICTEVDSFCSYSSFTAVQFPVVYPAPNFRVAVLFCREQQVRQSVRVGEYSGKVGQHITYSCILE